MRVNRSDGIGLTLEGLKLVLDLDLDEFVGFLAARHVARLLLNLHRLNYVISLFGGAAARTVH